MRCVKPSSATVSPSLTNSAMAPDRCGRGANRATGVAFSANDRYLVFSSWAANLVAGDTNIVPDAFVRDFGN